MFVAVELNEIVENANEITVYNEGKIFTYKSGEKQFGEIMKGWSVLTENVHEMPAFGVSIDKETRDALQRGLWVEFSFADQQIHSEMTFDKLLVCIEKGFTGFNIIRYNAEYGYSGRCYYYDLVNKDMTYFYDIIVNL